MSMTLPTNFYYVTQIILQMQSRDQSLATQAFQWEKLSKQKFYKDMKKKKKLGIIFSIIWDWH